MSANHDQEGTLSRFFLSEGDLTDQAITSRDSCTLYVLRCSEVSW